MESKEWLHQKITPIPDDVLRWGLKYTCLMDKGYLANQLKTRSQVDVARDIGCTPKLLRKALKFHNLTTIQGRGGCKYNKE